MSKMKSCPCGIASAGDTCTHCGATLPHKGNWNRSGVGQVYACAVCGGPTDLQVDLALPSRPTVLCDRCTLGTPTQGTCNAHGCVNRAVTNSPNGGLWCAEHDPSKLNVGTFTVPQGSLRVPVQPGSIMDDFLKATVESGPPCNTCDDHPGEYGTNCRACDADKAAYRKWKANKERS